MNYLKVFFNELSDVTENKVALGHFSPYFLAATDAGLSGQVRCMKGKISYTTVWTKVRPIGADRQRSAGLPGDGCQPFGTTVLVGTKLA